jgi:hypothetical protein
MEKTEPFSAKAIAIARMCWHELRRRYFAMTKPDLQLKGFPPAPFPTPRLSEMSDSDLEELNGLLPWRCFTVDALGRRIGNRAWPGKREDPQCIPDRRTGLLADSFPAARSVLEIGCFEGVHTIALCQRFADVTAVDARIANVVKTIVRCHLYGFSPRVSVCDVESQEIPEAHIVHHVGVLYHLFDPVGHLQRLAPKVRDGLMLDTHVAREDEVTDSINGVRYKEMPEFGAVDAFSGVRIASRWLHVDDLVAVLRLVGFESVDIVEQRNERNGLRILLVAKRGQ